MATTELTVYQRVDAGAAWLDENRPGWFDEINLDELDMTEACNCVLGQIVRSCNDFDGDEVSAFWTLIDPDAAEYVPRGLQGMVMTANEAEAMGFHIERTGDTDREWRALTIAWSGKILSRRITRP